MKLSAKNKLDIVVNEIEERKREVDREINDYERKMEELRV